MTQSEFEKLLDEIRSVEVSPPVAYLIRLMRLRDSEPITEGLRKAIIDVVCDAVHAHYESETGVIVFEPFPHEN